MGLGCWLSSLLEVPGEPFCRLEVTHQQVPQPPLYSPVAASDIPDTASGAFWLPSLFPTQPLSLKKPRWMCHQCQLAIGTDLEWHLILSDLIELSLGHGCPSQRQLFLRDGFRGFVSSMFPVHHVPFEGDY